MTPTADPVTLALTSHLPVLLIVAAILTWPIAIGLLRLYIRAVKRSMRTTASKASRVPEAGTSGIVETAGSRVAGTPTVAAHGDGTGAIGADAEALFAQLIARPRQAAAVYAVAGCVYAVLTTFAQLRAGGLEVLPVRFLMLSWIFVWPVVLTSALVAATTRRERVAITAIYFAGLAALGAVGIRLSPDSTWGQLVFLWALYDLPPTVLLMTCLSRKVRAVGPLILTFMFLALAGSDVITSVAGSRDTWLRAVIVLAGRMGLGSRGALVGLVAIGFAAFGLIGWIALTWISRRYQAKRISDESLAIDAVWLLFTVAYTMDLVFENPLWAFAGVATFAAYKISVWAAFGWLRRRLSSENTRSLLVLRSFSIGRDTERLFDAVAKHWRRSGSIQLIAGVDLATSTVEPHEFLDFTSGKLSRRFIDGPLAIARRLSERDTAWDRDLRFRVNDYFCYDDTWKMVLDGLVQVSDAVLMDLRGFTAENHGCVFEIHELVRLMPLERVVFVIDGRTDARLLDMTLEGATAGSARAPTKGGASSKAQVIRLPSLTPGNLRQLLRALAGAAAPLVSAADSGAPSAVVPAVTSPA